MEIGHLTSYVVAVILGHPAFIVNAKGKAAPKGGMIR
jgi:hypothetical protein